MLDIVHDLTHHSHAAHLHHVQWSRLCAALHQPSHRRAALSPRWPLGQLATVGVASAAAAAERVGPALVLALRFVAEKK